MLPQSLNATHPARGCKRVTHRQRDALAIKSQPDTKSLETAQAARTTAATRCAADGRRPGQKAEEGTCRPGRMLGMRTSVRDVAGVAARPASARARAGQRPSRPWQLHTTLASSRCPARSRSCFCSLSTIRSGSIGRRHAGTQSSCFQPGGCRSRKLSRCLPRSGCYRGRCTRLRSRSSGRFAGSTGRGCDPVGALSVRLAFALLALPLWSRRLMRLGQVPAQKTTPLGALAPTLGLAAALTPVGVVDARGEAAGHVSTSRSEV
jgi:hypothetical protein